MGYLRGYGALHAHLQGLLGMDIPAISDGAFRQVLRSLR
jgi:hypothetical protein